MAREYTYMPFGKGAHRLEVVLERKVRRGGYADLLYQNNFRERSVSLCEKIFWMR